MQIELENGTMVEIYSGPDYTTVEIQDDTGKCLATCSMDISEAMEKVSDD